MTAPDREADADGKYYKGILGTIGKTPLVRLDRIFPELDVQIFAKLEAFNPAGSAKDRPATRMLSKALERGDINSETTIVESSSGNLAIALAQACSALGLKLIVVVDPKTTAANLKIMRAYGATIDMVTEPNPETGEFLAARRARIKDLLGTLPNAHNLNQYANPNNWASHYHGTMQEIIDGMSGRIDYLFVAVSTCGTLRGTATALNHQGLNTKVVAVDAAGSVIFGTRGPRLLPGHGAGIVPEQMKPGLADNSVLVTDADCVAGCRALIGREAVLAGASSGGIIAAIEKMRHEIEPGARIACILADRGERYLDTVYSNDWCKKQFGCVPQLGGHSGQIEKRPQHSRDIKEVPVA